MTNDYQRIAASIQRLQSDFLNQPSLSELAEAADLSPHHFQRLFVRWAGVSPKKFLQCLTVQAARQRLEAGASVLDAALDSGLSGPGRLHDLTVRLEAASPGEIKSGGAGWTIGFGFGDSPFGTCFTATGPRGILRLAFVEDVDPDAARQSLQQEWRAAEFRHDDVAAQACINHIFEASDRQERLSCLVRGTAFQVRVWRALLEIPTGQLVTYRQVADLAKHPQAVRAVGTAIGRNPIGYLIPCHRVIRSTGVIGGYRWGATRKRLLIATELSQSGG